MAQCILDYFECCSWVRSMDDGNVSCSHYLVFSICHIIIVIHISLLIILTTNARILQSDLLCECNFSLLII